MLLVAREAEQSGVNLDHHAVRRWCGAVMDRADTHESRLPVIRRQRITTDVTAPEVRIERADPFKRLLEVWLVAGHLVERQGRARHLRIVVGNRGST